MQILADDGTRIAARVNGREHRNALVLIHGFPFSSRLWDEHAEALARDVCVVAPDLRGAGQSGAPSGPCLMETLASDLCQLLDALGIERVSIAGHSMGGYVALAFARMFSERVERLALVASRLRADTPEEAQARRALAGRIELARSIEPAIDAMFPRFFAPETREKHPEVVSRAAAIASENSAAGAAATVRGMALRAPAQDIAEDLDVPVLVLAGRADTIVTETEATEIARTFPRGELRICAQSAHLPMLEEPGRARDALRDWLARA